MKDVYALAHAIEKTEEWFSEKAVDYNLFPSVRETALKAITFYLKEKEDNENAG